MVLDAILLLMLLLGFFLGRVWEIRHQILRGELVGKRQPPNSASANGGSGQAQAAHLERSPSKSPSHRRNNGLPAGPTSDAEFRGDAAHFTDRFRRLYRSAHDVGISVA